MTPTDPKTPPKCRAHNHKGQPCGSLALRGQRVCHYHGGKSPQALRSAEQRMRDLVYPALSALERQINKDEFPATKYVLDWAGFRPVGPGESPSEHAVQVTVVFDHANETPTLILDAAQD